jgi:hypothetical protein
MKLGTRLLLPLLATVAGVMLVYALWAVRQGSPSAASDRRRTVPAPDRLVPCVGAVAPAAIAAPEAHP